MKEQLSKINYSSLYFFSLLFFLHLTQSSFCETHGYRHNVPQQYSRREISGSAELENYDDVIWQVAQKDKRARITNAIRDVKVCQQGKLHSNWLATRNFPAELPGNMAHANYEKRADELVGPSVGSRGFRANQFEEIVSEALPNLTAEEAAKQCLNSWYNSPKHRPTLTNPNAQWSCLTMSRSKNSKNPRWYCVGLALYYR